MGKTVVTVQVQDESQNGVEVTLTDGSTETVEIGEAKDFAVFPGQRIESIIEAGDETDYSPAEDVDASDAAELEEEDGEGAPENHNA